MAKFLGLQGFPSFDSFHAHCAMSVTFADKSCQDAYNVMKDRIEAWTPEPLAGGVYKLYDAIEDERIWATRTTPKKHYVDDILFEYFGDSKDFQAKGCTVSAKSRSQSLSYYDYDTNFCNMWNVLKEVSGPGMTIKVDQCKFQPKEEEIAATCAVY